MHVSFDAVHYYVIKAIIINKTFFGYSSSLYTCKSPYLYNPNDFSELPLHPVFDYNLNWVGDISNSEYVRLVKEGYIVEPLP